MTEAGLISGIIGALVAVLVALITVWRFRRKDRAEAAQVEDGTIASRFKDADALMRYVDESVEARVAPIRAELEASHSAIEAFREWVSQIWAWDRRGRQGNMPMVSGDMLRKLGLVHLTSVDIDEDTHPT